MKEQFGNQWALLKSCHYYVMAARDSWDRRTSVKAMLRAIVKYTQMLEELCDEPREPKFRDNPCYPPVPSTDPVYTAADRVERKLLGSIKGGKWVPAEEEAGDG